MLNIGIVGSQGKAFSELQKQEAMHLITLIAVFHDGNQIRLVSGGEPTGVDAWAEWVTKDWWITEPVIHKPTTYDWDGYKARNILIAEDSDILYAIRSRNSKTYGSGWTADYAEKLGKEVYRYYV